MRDALLIGQTARVMTPCTSLAWMPHDRGEEGSNGYTDSERYLEDCECVCVWFLLLSGRTPWMAVNISRAVHFDRQLVVGITVKPNRPCQCCHAPDHPGHELVSQ